MTLLRNLSGPWSFAMTLALLFTLFEPRYSRRITIVLSVIVITPLTLFAEYMYLSRGSEYGGQVIFFIYVLPVMVFFWIMSKYRDGRYFSTFFYTQIFSVLIITLSNLADYFFTGESFVLMLASRLFFYPLTIWIIVTRLRQPYLEFQNLEPRGWGTFAVITSMYCILMLVMFNYPSILSKRPGDIPAYLIVALLAPITCNQYILNFVHLREISDAHEQDELLRIQTSALADRLEQLEESQRATAIYRHDRRHRAHTLIELIEKGDTESAISYLRSTEDTIAESAPPMRYCQNTVLNAVFTAYFAAAGDAGIKVEYEIDLPGVLSFDENAFSIVLANGLENAIRENKKLSPEERSIIVRCYITPQLMLRISNPCRTAPLFSPDGLPLSSEKGHGIGTASIRAYCDKHKATCSYRCSGGVFTMTLVQSVN